ncbi:MAG: asparagine synthase-related protein [Desulfomonilaceae bacterium]
MYKEAGPARIVEEMFSAKRLEEQGLFRWDVVAELVQRHNQGLADHRKELWNMLVLQLWLNENKYRIV